LQAFPEPALAAMHEQHAPASAPQRRYNSRHTSGHALGSVLGTPSRAAHELVHLPVDSPAVARFIPAPTVPATATQASATRTKRGAAPRANFQIAKGDRDGNGYRPATDEGKPPTAGHTHRFPSSGPACRGKSRLVILPK
jgi:hypothetical protein